MINDGPGVAAYQNKILHEKCGKLQKMSKEVEDSELADVAAVSAGNNYEIGNMIAEAMSKVGRQGVVTLEEGKSAAHQRERVLLTTGRKGALLTRGGGCVGGGKVEAPSRRRGDGTTCRSEADVGAAPGGPAASRAAPGGRRAWGAGREPAWVPRRAPASRLPMLTLTLARGEAKPRPSELGVGVGAAERIRHLQADTYPAIQRLKQQELVVQRRLLRTMRIVEVLENWGYHMPLTKEEADLYERLVDIVKQALQQQTEAVAKLGTVLKRDTRDVGILLSEDTDMAGDTVGRRAL